MPIDESAMAGQKIGTSRAVGCREDPVLPGLLPQVFAELVENSREVYGRRSSVNANVGDPLVVVAELFFAGVSVVDPIDSLGLQRRIVLVRRTEVVTAAARLVQIVVEVGAGRDQAVDVAVRR